MRKLWYKAGVDLGWREKGKNFAKEEIKKTRCAGNMNENKRPI